MSWYDAPADVISSRRMEAKEAGREEIPNVVQIRQMLFTVITFAQEDESARALETMEKALRAPDVAQSMNHRCY